MRVVGAHVLLALTAAVETHNSGIMRHGKWPAPLAHVHSRPLPARRLTLLRLENERGEGRREAQCQGLDWDNRNHTANISDIVPKVHTWQETSRSQVKKKGPSEAQAIKKLEVTGYVPSTPTAEHSRVPRYLATTQSYPGQQLHLPRSPCTHAHRQGIHARCAEAR